MMKVSGADTCVSRLCLAVQVNLAPTSLFTAVYCRPDVVVDRPVDGSIFTLGVMMMAESANKQSKQIRG